MISFNSLRLFSQIMLKVVKSSILPKNHFIFITRALWDKCKVKKESCSSVVMSSRSMLSFFKKTVNTVNNGADDVVNIPESSCTVVNSDVNSENISSGSYWCSLPEKPSHPSKNFVFPKTKFGSQNPLPVNITGLITIHGCILFRF